MILIELLIFLSTLLPVFHLLNAFFTRRKTERLMENQEKRFGILIPCFNEEDTVRTSIYGLLNMNYKNFEAIYINDGSNDHTLKTLDDELDLKRIDRGLKNKLLYQIKAIYKSQKYDNFYVIDKKNEGKSGCLNAGLAFTQTDYIVTLDADSVLEKDALNYMNHIFEDEQVAAAGGTIHIIQGYDSRYLDNKIELKKRILITLQILDYLKGFYIYKMSLSRQKANIVISGAFGVFRKDTLIAVKGFRKTLGEDIDITIRIQKLIHKTRQKVVYEPKALCFTQCPEKWRDLIKQRMRWQKGFINCALHNGGYLLKSFFYRSLSFHFAVEAFVVGMSSCFYTLLTLALVFIFIFGTTQNLIVLGYYFLFRVVFSFVYSAGAIVISKRYHSYPKGTLKQAVYIMLLDVTFFWLFCIFIYLAGIVTYFWSPGKNNDWNKVERSKEFFMLH